jgi:ABC-type multidrug transport system ATPase subunit
MKKKLGLMLALLHQPQLLILDEPTNGLDVESTIAFYELMKEEAARGVTVVFSTHLMDQVNRLCTEVAIISQGRLSVTGSIEQLRSGLGESATLEDVFVHFTTGQPGAV